MPFMSSLIFTGTRVGGQREVATQHFEAVAAHFPRDYPSTSTYEAYASQREGEEKAKWERTPPAKRVNFEKLGTRSPWKPDWDVVLGLRDPSEATIADENESDPDLVDTQRHPSEPESLPQSIDNRKPFSAHPWILRGADVGDIIKKISTMLNAAAGLYAEIVSLREKRNMNPVSIPISADELLRSALVHVRLEMPGRGAPEDFANIYEMNDIEATKWKRLKELRRRPGVEEEGIDETTVRL
jgi:ribonuclease P/MRP protein subunit POP1